jgi:pyruvate dehydrogenase E2 component (dihydrolipoamide acetyltransferase)
MVEVIMPKMGDGMEEGTLVEWLVKDGEKVKSGQVIGNIQTDKAVLELEAPSSGFFGGILLAAGGTVPVGIPIAAILKEGESVPAGWGSGKPVASEASVATEVVEPAKELVAASVSAPSDARIKASPLAKKIAAELGVDLSGVTGTGPDGRIVQKDVVEAKPVAVAAKAPTFAPVTSTAEDTVINLNKIRQITAKRTLESKTQVPHFYVTVEVDVEKILSFRAMFEEEGSGKVSINDFVVKASALALRDMPAVNAVFQGDKLLQYGGVHIGIAVALPDGLTVPVVKDADQKSLRQISAEVKDLARGAKENKLGLDKLTGSTFSISNMGMLDVDNFIAIINQPNAAILAIASVRKKVTVNEEDEIEVRSKMNITCSFDHRVLDGAIGANFINAVKTYLENPSRLLG